MAKKKQELMLVSDIKFDALNNAIKTLGEATDLKKSDKEAGRDILEKWEANVIDKLEVKESEFKDFKDFLSNGARYFYSHNGVTIGDLEEKLTKVAGTKRLYTKYLETALVEDQAKSERPVSPTTDPDKSVIENDKIYADYKRDVTLFDSMQRRLSRNSDLAWKKWYNTTRKHEAVLALLSEATTYLKNVSTYKTKCKDKAFLAQINLTISNKKAKEAISEMIAFSEGIL